MAATTQNDQGDSNVIAFPKPLRAIEKSNGKKRLPALSSSQIEDFFAHAEDRNKTLKIAA